MPDYQYPFDQFAHRNAHPIKDTPVLRQEVEKIVEKLFDLEKRTHPENSDPDEKELDSISALVWAGKLVEKLAGWAIDHRAGMILNGATVFPWPESDQDAPPQSNDQRHEALGSAYLRDESFRDPLNNRHIIAEVATRAPFVPATLRTDFSEAIRALDLGEVRPLLMPSKGQREKAYTLWQFHLRAIEYVHFLWGTGVSKDKALDEVAQAFGKSKATVDSWDRSDLGLRRHVGPAALKVAQDTAKQSGELFQRLQMQIHKSDEDEEHINVLLMTYGPEVLSLNGQRFKNASRGDME